uniref:Uncharacterized protein n=1 Tax=Rhizophora mucronata TaxID=61149 RepID=A0A2P2K6U7_RHIMU
MQSMKNVLKRKDLLPQNNSK